jgi:integrase
MPEALSDKFGNYIGRYALSDTDRVFPITSTASLAHYQTMCGQRAGLESPGVLPFTRHGGAIARLKRSGNPKSLQIHLGHSDIKMTMRYLSTLQLMESLEIEDKVKF